MSKFTDRLWDDLAREHGPALALADRPEPGRARHPRAGVLAGGTLALAGAGAALTVTLTAMGSTPAYAVTRNSNGSVLVKINQLQALPDANRKLTAMGINEQISIQMATGAASVNGPVNCVPSPPGASLPGPPVEALVGTDGTEVIPSGNTGAGTWHLAACYLHNTNNTGNTGNTGAG